MNTSFLCFQVIINFTRLFEQEKAKNQRNTLHSIFVCAPIVFDTLVSVRFLFHHKYLSTNLTVYLSTRTLESHESHLDEVLLFSIRIKANRLSSSNLSTASRTTIQLNRRNYRVKKIDSLLSFVKYYRIFAIKIILPYRSLYFLRFTILRLGFSTGIRKIKYDHLYLLLLLSFLGFFF